MKENKCSVQFICHGNKSTCKFWKVWIFGGSPQKVSCEHCVEGNCHCADAMIGALEAEGYEVKE